MNGTELLGHHIVVEREHLGGIQVSPVDVNEDALRAMVKRLLAQVLVATDSPAHTLRTVSQHT
jgi:hypothetical protein